MSVKDGSTTRVNLGPSVQTLEKALTGFRFVFLLNKITNILPGCAQRHASPLIPNSVKSTTISVGQKSSVPGTSAGSCRERTFEGLWWGGNGHTGQHVPFFEDLVESLTREANEFLVQSSIDTLETWWPHMAGRVRTEEARLTASSLLFPLMFKVI